MTDAEYLYQLAKARAKRKGREFVITVQDIESVDTDTCPYLNIPIRRGEHIAGTGQRAQTPNAKSLDRIDSEKGYVPGNIIVCSWRANSLLKDGSLSELTLLVNNFRRILNSTKPTDESQTTN